MLSSACHELPRSSLSSDLSISARYAKYWQNLLNSSPLVSVCGRSMVEGGICCRRGGWCSWGLVSWKMTWHGFQKKCTKNSYRGAVSSLVLHRIISNCCTWMINNKINVCSRESCKHVCFLDNCACSFLKVMHLSLPGSGSPILFSVERANFSTCCAYRLVWSCTRDFVPGMLYTCTNREVGGGKEQRIARFYLKISTDMQSRHGSSGQFPLYPDSAVI